MEINDIKTPEQKEKILYRKKFIKWSILSFCFASIAPCLVHYSRVKAVFPNGSLPDGFSGASFWGMIFTLPVILLLIVSPFYVLGAMFYKKYHKKYLLRATFCLICICSFWALIYVGEKVSDTIRINEFKKLAEKSSPLINAINEYDKKYAHPPETLQALIPEFLPQIPGTSMGAYPSYEYKVLKNAKNNHEKNKWVLWVPCPLHLINRDEFLYFPKQNYPERDGGGWYERVGDWAYYHE